MIKTPLNTFNIETNLNEIRRGTHHFVNNIILLQAYIVGTRLEQTRFYKEPALNVISLFFLTKIVLFYRIINCIILLRGNV